MQPTVEVLSDKPALVERATVLVIEKIKGAIAARGRCHLSLAGGSTPKPLYEALAKADLPWASLYIYWGDERFVPADHADSNDRMVRTAWLNHVPIPADHIFPVPTAAGSPEAAAEQYEQTLRQSFGEGTAFPSFDIILLGMGDDGHTASLFPHTPVLQEQTRWVGVGKKDDQPRITLTVPVINAAQTVIFLVAGANKQTALSQVFAPEADADVYPARRVQPDGQLIWLLDEAASKGLPT
ncbi:MAG: 6-phosphogluconolactonase [Cyanobacteria bacterium P01_D01_bin.14]